MVDFERQPPYHGNSWRIVGATNSKLSNLKGKKMSIGKYLAVLGLIAGVAASGGAWAGLSDGLVGYWDFDGNANDKSGNGNNGVVSGATLTADRTGKANSAYLFDGTKGSIVVPSSPSLHPVNQLTIAFWFKKNGITGDWTPIIFKGGDKNGKSWDNREYSVWLNSQPRFHVTSAGDGSEEHILDGSALTQTGWLHFAATIDRQTHVMKSYINGVLDTQQTDSYSSFSSNNYDLVFGGTGEQGNGFSYFNGALDDVRIYNRALSSAEIQQLATNQTGICDTTTPYNQGYAAAQAACKANPSSCGITASTSGSIVTTTGHATYTPSSNLVHIPYLDVPTIFGGTSSVYEIDLTVIPNTDPLQLKLQNAKQVQ
jgi:hypothetical protein